MKKYICLIVVVMLACTLCSCIPVSENPRQETDNISISIYRDKETGVNYYIYSAGYTGGMTIRVNEDGSPYVSEVE